MHQLFGPTKCILDLRWPDCFEYLLTEEEGQDLSLRGDRYSLQVAGPFVSWLTVITWWLGLAGTKARTLFSIPGEGGGGPWFSRE